MVLSGNRPPTVRAKGKGDDPSRFPASAKQRKKRRFSRRCPLAVIIDVYREADVNRLQNTAGVRLLSLGCTGKGAPVLALPGMEIWPGR